VKALGIEQMLTHPPISEEYRNTAPRLDPLGIFPRLSRLTDGELGRVAQTRLARAFALRATVRDRHVLDLVGHVLSLREHVPAQGPAA
jgi:hypothetical protein